MAFDANNLLTGVTGPLKSLGRFDRVIAGEPAVIPTARLCAVTLVDVATAPGMSGLAVAALRVEFKIEFFLPLVSGDVASATVEAEALSVGALVMGALIGQFGVRAGLGYHVDLLGAHGTRLNCRYGYASVDGAMFRLGTVTMPVIVADAFDQAE